MKTKLTLTEWVIIIICLILLGVGELIFSWAMGVDMLRAFAATFAGLLILGCVITIYMLLYTREEDKKQIHVVDSWEEFTKQFLNGSESLDEYSKEYYKKYPNNE